MLNNLEEGKPLKEKKQQASKQNVKFTQPETEVRQLVKRLAEETSLHGFKQLHDNKGARKYVWITALILAVVLVIVLFRSTVTDFFQYRTYIESQIREEIPSLPFPTVTICFSDNFVDFKYETFPANITFEEYKQIFAVIHKDRSITEEDIALFDRINITSYEQLMKSYHLTLEDTVLYNTSLIFNHDRHCSFSKQKCSIEDIKLVWQIDGCRSCIQFNSYSPGKKPREQTHIYSPFRTYQDARAKYNKKLFAKKVYRYRKITLYVHKYGIPHHIYKGKNTNAVLLDKFLMDPGVLHKFYMDRNQVKYLPPPYGTCGTKPLKVVKHYPYSVNTCIMDCVLQYVIQKCQCIRFDLKYAIDADVPVCSTSQMVRCYINANKNARKKNQGCIDACPLHCERDEFNIGRENVPLPTHHDDEIEEFLGLTEDNRSQTTEYIKGQVIGVELKYRRMREYNQIYTPLVSLTLLLATIGGSIGLGMGISLLTIVEFCMFIGDSLKAIFLQVCGKVTTRNENGVQRNHHEESVH